MMQDSQHRAFRERLSMSGVRLNPVGHRRIKDAADGVKVPLYVRSLSGNLTPCWLGCAQPGCPGDSRLSLEPDTAVRD